MERAFFSPGDIIFRQGDKSEQAYWILSGKVEISIETPLGPEVLTTLQEGELFGEMGMIDDLPREATARVIAPTEAEVIQVADFREQIIRKEDRLMRYLDTLFDRLRHTNALLRKHLGNRWAEAPLATGPQPDRSRDVVPPLTIFPTEASAGLFPDGWELIATRFPFRIGRSNDDGYPFSPMDLPLPDQQPFVVSRSHCRIECKVGAYYVRDVGSSTGTIVNGVAIGTEHPGLTAALKPGENTLTIGPWSSRHQYRIVIG
ncbi:MAG: cyclic nucleotide-binding domain-containing protein [Verrucomicrobiales bacterium]